MRVGNHLWVGEEDEPLQPPLIFGMSRMDPCDKCGGLTQCAWLSADKDGERFLDVYLCRDCLMELVGFTYPSKDRPVQDGRLKVRLTKPDRPSIPAKLRFSILKRDGYRCQVCGRTATDGVTLHIDHKTPLAAGGETNETNLWVLCEPCNLGKGADEL